MIFKKILKFGDIANRNFSAYLRFEVLDKSGVLSDITNIFSKNKVSIKRLIQDPNPNKLSSSIVIITHNCKNDLLTKSLKKLEKKAYIIGKPKLKVWMLWSTKQVWNSIAQKTVLKSQYTCHIAQRPS